MNAPISYPFQEIKRHTTLREWLECFEYKFSFISRWVKWMVEKMVAISPKNPDEYGLALLSRNKKWEWSDKVITNNNDAFRTLWTVLEAVRYFYDEWNEEIISFAWQKWRKKLYERFSSRHREHFEDIFNIDYDPLSWYIIYSKQAQARMEEEMRTQLKKIWMLS